MASSKTPAITDITPEKSEHIKGIALLLLMWHHLFGVNYIEKWLSPIEGIDMFIGVSAKICLGIFLFCSGYGLYKSYINKDNPGRFYTLKKIVQTLIPYWLIMLVAIAVLVYLKKFNPKYIFVSLFALIHDDEMLYVSFSWYIKLYILLMLILPLIRLIERKWKKNIIIDLLLYIALPFAVYYVFKGYMDEEHFISIPRSIISSSLFLLFWFPLFAIGFIFAKYEIYKKILKFTSRFSSPLVIIIAFLICGYVIYMRFLFYYYCIADVIYAPLFVIACLLIMDNIKFKSKYVLPYLGKKSLYYWLLSGMFFLNTSELTVLITWPQIPVFILIWTLLLLTPFVFAVDFLSGKILKLIFRK